MLLKEGDAGPAVAVLQQHLGALGYLKVAETGFGAVTAQALRRFQRARGLAADGVLGPRTRARLFPLIRLCREYLTGTLYPGQEAWDPLDEITAAVAAGEGGAFDALQLNGDGAGLSFGLLQWAQNPGSLGLLLQVMEEADPGKFTGILGGGDPLAARRLLARTRGPGKKLPLWLDPWPWRFWLAGRDQEFQRVQHRLARRQVAQLLTAGYEAYPARFKTEGRVALRALVMMADVGNQAGPLGLRRALKFAESREGGEAAFIRALGTYVENLISRKYGDPNYGNTVGRHEAICARCGLEPVDWPKIKMQLDPGMRRIS